MACNQQTPIPYYQTPVQQPGGMYPRYGNTQPMMPTTPGLMPTYPTYPSVPQMPARPIVPVEEGPPTTTNIGYTPAYLRTQIGQKVKIEFLIGTSILIDRDGTLVDVGINYVIIQPSETDDLMLCDMYSIKFVTFFN